jgi:Flp pilus assembly pilin Flp
VEANVMSDKNQLEVATKKSALRKFARDERGAGLVEYILLAGLIAIAAIVAFRGFEGKVSGTVTKQGQKIETELSPK